MNKILVLQMLRVLDKNPRSFIPLKYRVELKKLERLMTEKNCHKKTLVTKWVQKNVQ